MPECLGVTYHVTYVRHGDCMHSLRSKLIAAFIIATLMPLGATIWITTSLLERSLGYATTEELDRLSRTLEGTVQAVLPAGTRLAQARRPRRSHRAIVVRRQPIGPPGPRMFAPSGTAASRNVSACRAPAATTWTSCAGRVTASWCSVVTSAGFGCRNCRRNSGGLVSWSGAIESRDLRRGFTLTLLLLVGAVWLVSLAPLLFIAHRISSPIRQLTAGLTGFAAGAVGSPAREGA